MTTDNSFLVILAAIWCVYCAMTLVWIALILARGLDRIAEELRQGRTRKPE